MNNKSNSPITSIQWRPYHSEIYVGNSQGIINIWDS